MVFTTQVMYGIVLTPEGHYPTLPPSPKHHHHCVGVYKKGALGLANVTIDSAKHLSKLQELLHLLILRLHHITTSGVCCIMSGQGKGTRHSDLSHAGYTSSGIVKDSVGAAMMSHADRSGSGKDVVSALQSAGARDQSISGSDMNRSDLDSAGLTRSGVTKGSGGANMMSNVDKSESGDGMKACLQSMGAKK
ncbi:uncharacterized protein LOC123516000 isoform X2 [Portunus trituberculatus]|uniref:uncharacterized protein LOC123516000 isoform X2 n=1 Tax=Portunus trituberculatus TaxID=210409 RepID=UPI001E1CBFCA|nr:uncharacterized protein LOC123516000 isoform X2 [Portunus trituberculatus]